MPTNQPPERPKKLQRISQACDLCHRRSIRCRPSTENPQHQCQNCYDFAVDCTYNRPSRRRRNQSTVHVTPPNLLPSQQDASPVSPVSKVEGQVSNHDNVFTVVPESNVSEPDQDAPSSGLAWRSFAAACLPTIEQCLEVYMDVVYPMFPLFHGPTLWSRIRKRHHLTDRAFFASVMAACALASARARDGAIGDKHSLNDGTENLSETFFTAARDALFKDFSKSLDLGYLRACALLALTSIQYGNHQTMHQYVGHYHTLCAMQHFHDEDRWPAHLSIEEKEDRRRLFWAMYAWDIYCACVFNTILRGQETHSNVRYPTEINDEDLTSGVQTPIDELNWLRGWNFALDLYRVLEHTLRRLRRNNQKRNDRINVVGLLIGEAVPDMQIMDNVLNLYYQLPARFKEYKAPVTGEKNQDIFGFQAANIQATLHLVRITLFESNKWHDVQQKCDVAEQTLSIFRSIETHYLRAISTPMLHHLAGIGQVLASVMRGTLTENSYERVRMLLGSMADLLEGLESKLHPTAGASQGLRAQIHKIDQFMHAQRQMLASIMAAQHQQDIDTMMDSSAAEPANTIEQLALPPSNSLGMTTPLDEFQLPSDLIGEWPWPFDLMQEGNQAMANEYGYGS